MSVFHCAVGSLNSSTMPPALRADEHSVPTQLRDSSFPSRIIFSLIPIFWNPPVGSAFITLSLSMTLPAALFLHWSTPSTTGSNLSRRPSLGQTPHSTHHCVLPLANARTLCRLIASSRNPATFSLSSCRLKKHAYIPHKKENKTLLLKTAFISTSFMKA